MGATNLWLRSILLQLYSKCKDSVMCVNAHIGDINEIFGTSIQDLDDVSNKPENFVGSIMNAGLTESQKTKLINIINISN